MESIVYAVGPICPFEWILVKNYVDLTIEIERWRGAIAGIIDAARKRAILDILADLNDYKLGFVDMPWRSRELTRLCS